MRVPEISWGWPRSIVTEKKKRTLISIDTSKESAIMLISNIQDIHQICKLIMRVA